MSAVTDRIVELVRTNYLFPDAAERIAAEIGARNYSGIDDPKELAAALTKDLRELSNDKHLLLVHHITAQSSADVGGSHMRDWVKRAVQHNYGFERVDRLDGNIGYIDLRMVFSPEFAGDTAAAAMQLVAHTDALILDLRHNTGGVPDMVALLCSYLLDPDPPTHLNDFVARDGERRASWTVKEVAGPRYLKKPVYVLIGPETVSGGEELAYVLKHLGRAMTVGEHTAGAAHVAPPFRVDDHFQVFISVGRPIHPTTGTNWEGVGVEPDVPVAAGDALETALTLARGER